MDPLAMVGIDEVQSGTSNPDRISPEPGSGTSTIYPKDFRPARFVASHHPHSRLSCRRAIPNGAVTPQRRSYRRID